MEGITRRKLRLRLWLWLRPELKLSLTLWLSPKKWRPLFYVAEKSDLLETLSQANPSLEGTV